ncbi:MAG: ferrous iron transport protein B [Methanoregula sp.]|jgi:ferrous iron transport protein B
MDNKKIRIALAGNPNVGKSTLFNAITGAHQHVGNWPGVTVEKKSGNILHQGHDLEIVDLPGTYSLTAYSADEVVARDYLIDEKPDVVIHVIDATNLERNLYLTTQLLETGVPVVIALNMSDMSEQRGDQISRKKMEEYLEVPVVRTVGSRGEGIKELLNAAVHEAETSPHHEHSIGYGDKTEQVIAKLCDILNRDAALTKKYPARWLATRLLEGDENAQEKIGTSTVKNNVNVFLKTIDTGEYEAAMADRRYDIISAILPQVCTTCVKKMNASDLIDRVVTNRFLGIPIFLALMWGAFELTFAAAAPFTSAINAGIAALGSAVTAGMEPGPLTSFINDGLIGGVGTVLGFVPNIFILLLILAILEDSGYLARAAFVMDRLMYAIGLPGKSFIPMLIGFGCNVPAIMATRTIEDKKDRLITILVNPFISCGARLPVYVLFAGVFFPENAGTVIFGLYVLGIVIAILSAKLFRSTILPGKPAPFLMEMPPYRLPTVMTSLIHMWDRGSMYLRKAGGVILAVAIIVWALASLPYGVEYGGAESYAGIIGHVLQPLVAPLGFDWKIAVALLFGFMAKEVVVGSLGVLYGVGEDGLGSALLADPSMGAVTALALMVFVLLYLPCMAAMAVIKKETGSWKWTGFSVVYGIVVAYLAALAVVYIAPFFIGGA